MKKIFLITSSLLILSISGCLNYIQDMTIYPDGSGKMKINYWMNFHSSENIPVIESIGIFNPDSIRNEFSSDFTKVTFIEAKSDTTDSTLHAIIHLDFTHVDSLSKLKVFSQYEFSLKDGASGQKIYTQFIPPITTGFGIDGSKYSVTYNIDFRGDIVTHNATNQIGKNLSWSYTLPEIGRGKTISVTFKPFKLKETPYWIFILSGLVLLVVIIFLLKKKKD
ncbi:MAG: hypothetical protein MUO34_08685 [Ignavibacteriaceae bacterium]|nr:hypothetical protein [Ignavibacteriaceae bacterium]